MLRIYLAAIAVIALTGFLLGHDADCTRITPFGGDYVNIWTASFLTLQGEVGRLSDPDFFYAVQQSCFGEEFELHNWSYSPLLLLFIWPFSLMPYAFGFTVWIGLSALPILLAIRYYNWPLWISLLVFFSGAGLVNMLTGQNGFITAGLLAIGLEARNRHPWASALSLGLLTFKPHLGLLVPLLLLMEHRWKLILQTIAVIVSLFLVSMALWGIEPWQEYFTRTTGTQISVLTDWGGLMLEVMPSVFVGARLLGMDNMNAAIIQLIFSVLAGAYVIHSLWHIRNEYLRQATLMIGTLVILPYYFLYDMVIYHWAILLITFRNGLSEETYKSVLQGKWMAISLLLFLWPFFCEKYAQVTDIVLIPVIPVTPLLLLALLGYIRYADGRQPVKRTTPSGTGTRPPTPSHG